MGDDDDDNITPLTWESLESASTRLDSISSRRSLSSLERIPEEGNVQPKNLYALKDDPPSKQDPALMALPETQLTRTRPRPEHQQSPQPKPPPRSSTEQEPTNNDDSKNAATKNSKQWIQTIMWKDLSSNDVTVVSGTMDELRNVIDAEVENREYLTRSGGVMTIMGVMEGRIESESVQFMGCTILERLAS